MTTTDYDAPRTAAEDEPATEVYDLTRARASTAPRVPLIDDPETEESKDLPEADPEETGLTIRVIPQQHDEFLCESCFLICHRSQLVQHSDGRQACFGCQG